MVRKLIRRVLRSLLGQKKKPVESAAPAPAPLGRAKGHKPHEQGPRKARDHQAPRAHPPRAHPPRHVPPPWDPASFEVPTIEGQTRFQDFDLPPEILHAIADLDFRYCTPIQAAILPPTLQGKDAYGRAQTGTGKTAAFLVAILTRFLRQPAKEPRRKGTPRALVIAPTRELVIQIEKDALELARYTPCRALAVYGGMDYDKQRQALTDYVVDLVVATPGRLLDFRRRGDIHLSQVEVLVIDEADRMLDLGFIPDVRTIVHSTPPKNERQTLFFSATLTPEVMRLASQWTTDPVSVEIAPEQVAVDTVNQKVYIVTIRDKFALLYNILTRENAPRVLVFANRRDHSERLMENLRRYGIDCALLTGAVDQRKRLRVLEDFRAGKIRVVVATDVAGRGLHVEGISHVINYNLPMDPEDYVHRIGRTGRAGVSGISVSFADEDDGHYLPQIEKFMGRALPCIHPEDDWLVLPAPLYAAREPKFSSRRPPGRSFGPRRGGGGPRRGGRRPH
ncbi:MAG: DEAD/DEAH box helicase [Verrucomicrobia bacterium]|nr:DEAD/DEAH box helicase [Verrucomicrobiota bacterium]